MVHNKQIRHSAAALPLFYMIQKYPKLAASRVGVFLAQPGGTLVGKDKPFANHWDLCSHLASMGAECVTAPAGGDFINLAEATAPGQKSVDYCGTLHERYAACGTPLVRLEAHLPGNISNIHFTRVPGFSAMLGEPTDPVQPGKLPFTKFEESGRTQMKQAIMASAALGLPNLVAFSGGRGWAASQYPWPAYPKDYRQWILALMVLKWRDNLELAADFGVRIGFELHPEQDLMSPLMLKLFRDAMNKVSPKAARAIAANADASHPTLIGDSADEHMAYLEEQQLLSMVHLKDGQILRCPGGSLWGDFSPDWTSSRRRFVTFGTGHAVWPLILPIWRQLHDRLDAGLDFIVEAECSRFPDMLQGIEIGIKNARRARDGKPLLIADDIEVRESALGNWEEFCSSNLDPAIPLAICDTERPLIEAILEQMGNVGA